MSRLERLMNLTATLLTAGRPLTADELRERVPGYPDDAGGRSAFRRAFERDKEALRAMGIPLDVVTPQEGVGAEGYVIRPEDYRLADPGLEADELAALHLAATAVRLEGLPGTEAIWKLGGASTPGGAAPPAVAALPGVPHLVALFAAVAERCPVALGYRGEQRQLDPWRLSFQRGHWYLAAWDHTRGAERQFRLDRIEGDVVAGAPGGFERPVHLEPGRLQPWELGQDQPVVARVRIDVDQAAWAVGHLGPDSVVARHGDGSIDVELSVTNVDAFRSFVLGFLDHAEVLEPPALRDELVAWLASVAATTPVPG